MSNTKVVSRSARWFTAAISAVLVGLLAAGMANAYSAAPTYSRYDDAIAQANAEKAAQDRALQQLAADLQHTDRAIADATLKLHELNIRLPQIQQEFDLAQQRFDAAVAQQKIVADKLAAAEAEDRDLAAKMVADEQRATDLRDALAQIALAEYQGSQINSTLAMFFGITTSDEFVSEFAYREATARVQANALAEVEEIAAVNRNREVRQDAVREYIVELKRIADELVIETEQARQVAETKKLELEKLLEETKGLKNFLEGQRQKALDQQAQIEREQAALMDELAILVAKKKAEEASGGGSLGKGYLSFPTRNVYVTSSYGMRLHPVLGYNRLHAGTDFRAYCGTELLAAAGGTVEWARSNGGFGNQVMLSHGIVGGKVLMTSYSHLTRFAVSAGQKVERGQVIGYSGNTGTSTACHLHFEVYVDGKTVDPMTLLPNY